MHFLKLGALVAVATLLAGCENQTVGERALTGALAGGLIAEATGGNAATGAAVGALGNVVAACVTNPNAPGC
jgi:hypothetical protein